MDYQLWTLATVRQNSYALVRECLLPENIEMVVECNILARCELGARVMSVRHVPVSL